MVGQDGRNSQGDSDVLIRYWRWALVWLLAVTAGCGGSADTGLVSCEAVDGVDVICGLVAPEDIERTPDNSALVVGVLGPPGGLLLLDPATDAVTTVYGERAGRAEPEPGWGDSACVEPPSWLQSHGIDVRQRADGRVQVLAVNHAERESVEYLELVPGNGGTEAIWRGCVIGPEYANFNDAVGLADGGFLVTHMASNDFPALRGLQAWLGMNTGHVYRWHPEQGFSIVPGSDARMPNGIALAADGESYYINEYFGNRVRRHALPGGELLASASVVQPDNLAWTEDGLLLVASHPVGLMELLASLEQGYESPSLLPFDVIELDAESLASRTLLSRDGPPMGAGTVALQHGEHVYIGSYVGERIIKEPLN